MWFTDSIAYLNIKVLHSSFVLFIAHGKILSQFARPLQYFLGLASVRQWCTVCNSTMRLKINRSYRIPSIRSITFAYRIGFHYTISFFPKFFWFWSYCILFPYVCVENFAITYLKTKTTHCIFGPGIKKSFTYNPPAYI